MLPMPRIVRPDSSPEVGSPAGPIPSSHLAEQRTVTMFCPRTSRVKKDEGPTRALSNCKKGLVTG